MSEVKNPEQRVDAPSVEQSPEKLRTVDNTQKQRTLEADKESVAKNVKGKDTSETGAGNNVESAKKQRELKEDSIGTDGKVAETKQPEEKETSALENETKSSFSRENFKQKNSFDARAKAEHPELNELKSKCVHDVSAMGTPENQIDRAPKGEYTKEERNHLKDIRGKIDAPTSNTIMQKVIGVDTGDIKKDLSSYLVPKTRGGEDTTAQVYGFVAKAEDAAPFTNTPQECHDNLRLDYDGTQYIDPNQSVYVVRFTDGENYNVPYSKEFGGEQSFSSPCTGNGFISGKDVTIPEYKVQPDENGYGAIVTDGEIYRINPDGSEEKVAYFDYEDGKFYLLEGDEQK